jgi:hypothetical protein
MEPHLKSQKSAKSKNTPKTHEFEEEKKALFGPINDKNLV